MKDYQQRVVNEKTELDERTDKLEAFIFGERFKSVPTDEQERMIKQLAVMFSYREILRQRIAAFT